MNGSLGMRSGSYLPTRRDRARRMYRALLKLSAALAAVLSLACVSAPAALADSASIDFLDATGKSDPVAGIGRTYALTGSSQAEKRVYVKVRAPGGAPCAPAAGTDPGDLIRGPSYSGDTRWYGTQVNGSFNLTFNNIWPSAGTFLFCIWIADSASATASPIAQTITFRSPTGTISATTSPVTPLTGQATTVTITGASEAPQDVYAKVRVAGGAPCGPSYSVDPGKSVLFGREVNGAFSTTTSIKQSMPGTYLICLWLADSSDDTTPVAGPQPVTYSVAAPCVVPAVGRKMTLKRARDALAKANCSAGSVTSKRARKRKKGRVIKFKPKSGRRLEPGATVAIVVSKGKSRTGKRR